MNNNFSFVIESTHIANKEFVPDKDGYYTVPGFVFDKPSRNGNFYDTASMINCITNPATRFYRTLMDKSLHGELDHPFTKDFNRLAKILSDNHAIYIKRIKTDVLKDGSKVIMVTFKPVLPKGHVYKEALEDPDRNAALSIRAACQEGPVQDNYRVLYPKALVTFDAVSCGGYREASKLVATESLEFNFTQEELLKDENRNLIFTESISSEAIMDLFNTDKIQRTTEIIKPTSMVIADNRAKTFHKRFF